MKPLTFLVAHRDRPKTSTRYFGPFPSDRSAYEFLEELPTPLKGGVSRVVPIQPFTSNEASLVRDKILDERAHAVIAA